jgi:uncharacterized protein (UPF0332 family)
MDYTGFKEKARQNLTVAEWCYQQGHYDACCNRAYYAMFHAAIAVLAKEGIIPTQEHIDHGWVQSQFVGYFCNRHKIFPQFRSYLSDALIRRNNADYRPESVNQRKTQQQLAWAKAFVHSILRRVE